MEASNLNNCYSEEFSKAKMKKITFDDINGYYKWQFYKAKVNFKKEILNQIKTKLPWISNEYRETIDRLAFSICTGDYILENYEEIKPVDEVDAIIKLYCYLRHNPDFRSEIIDKFIQFKAEKGFDYYGMVEINKKRYNFLQTLIYEHITMIGDKWEDKLDNEDETIEKIMRLMPLVNLSEKDSDNHDTLYYIHNCKKSEKLIKKMSNTDYITNIIDRIQQCCQTLNQMPGLVNKSLKFDNEYFYSLITLPVHLKSPNYATITQNFDIRVDPNGLIIDIHRQYKNNN